MLPRKRMSGTGQTAGAAPITLKSRQSYRSAKMLQTSSWRVLMENDVAAHQFARALKVVLATRGSTESLEAVNQILHPLGLHVGNPFEEPEARLETNRRVPFSEQVS